MITINGIRGKTALVTGATGHIGKAVCKRLLQEGAVVLAHGRQPDGAAKVAHELAAATGGVCEPVSCDLADLAQVSAMFQRLADATCALDILINNAAALGLSGPFLQNDPADWEYVFTVNVTAALLCAQLAAQMMVPRGGGVIVNVSSNGGRRGHRNRLAYDASKGALEAATRTMALELAPYRIRVNAVVPGAVRTSRWDGLSQEELSVRRSFVPLGREGLPDDIAGPIAFLCSDDAAYITGDTVTVDGGVMAQIRPLRDELDNGGGS